MNDRLRRYMGLADHPINLVLSKIEFIELERITDLPEVDELGNWKLGKRLPWIPLSPESLERKDNEST